MAFAIYYKNQQEYIRQRLSAIRYLSEGKSRAEVAQILGCTDLTIAKWIGKSCQATTTSDDGRRGNSSTIRTASHTSRSSTREVLSSTLELVADLEIADDLQLFVYIFTSLSVTDAAQDHGSVKKHYIRAPDPKNRQVGNLLDRLRDSRNQADYSDRIDKLDELAKAAIFQSRQVHTLLKQIYRS